MTEKFAVELLESQWELVVRALGYVYDRAEPEPGPTLQPIDKFSRVTVRRSITPIIREIKANVPGAGEDA